ncbi:hypothetical protein LINPERPRIM_LOCUS37148 [Linum perenne]
MLEVNGKEVQIQLTGFMEKTRPRLVTKVIPSCSTKSSLSFSGWVSYNNLFHMLPYQMFRGKIRNSTKF